MTILERLKKELPRLEQNVPLKNYVTFNIGGPAEYFLLAFSKDEAVHAIRVGKQLDIPMFVFGGGSNLLVPDEGIKGLVVKIKNIDTSFPVDGTNITADGGADLGNVVAFSLEKSLKGLEWAGGLPGTLGGAVRGNAGAFGGEIKDTVVSVEALVDNLQLKTFTNAECQFSYRSSIFKQKNWIILSVTLKLQKGDAQDLKNIANSRVAYRNEKHPLEYPSAGSVFKNVDVKKIPQEFMNEFADKVKQDPFPIVPAAWFIIGAGLKGKQIGQAQISVKHSNYIINLGGASAKNVRELIAFVQDAVKKKYGIELEPEVQIMEN